MLKVRGETFVGKVVAVLGSGNLAKFTVKKVNELGGKCVTLSDSNGFIYDLKGIDSEKLKFIMWLKKYKRGRIKGYAHKYGCEFFSDVSP